MEDRGRVASPAADVRRTTVGPVRSDVQISLRNDGSVTTVV